MIKIDLGNYNLRLIIITTLFLFVFKLFFSSKFIAILYNSLIEFSVFLFVFYLFQSIPKFSKLILNYLKYGVYYIIFFFNFFMFLLTSYYFNDALEMKYSFYQLSIGHIGFFMSSILQIWLIVFFVFICAILLVISKKKWKKITYKGAIFLIIPIIIFLSSFFIYESVNNVHATTFHDFTNSLTKSYFEVKSQPITSRFSYEFKNYSQDILENQKVLIFIMEQTTMNDFQEESSQIPIENNFFHKTKNSSHIYSNYYTNNQDSRTSIWTMLSSVFLPFEAYTSNWNSQYGFILKENNLVDYFNSKNYTTVTAASMYEPSLILGAYSWDNSVFLKKYPHENSICIHEFDYQKGCEDNVILSDVIEQINSYDNLFLLQEMIFGHGDKYLTEAKKSRVEYYNDYFNQIHKYLKQTNNLENTTIIIVADHGNKGYYTKDISDYNIPLIVYNEKLEHKEINDLYSHSKFKDIVLSYLSNSTLDPLNETYIIGQTQSRELAYINNNNQHFTAKNDVVRGYRIVNGNLPIGYVQNRLGELETYKTQVINRSSEEHFYCFFCNKNSIKIKAQRE